MLSGINVQRLFVAEPFTNLDSTGTFIYGSVIYSNGIHGVELSGTSATKVQNNFIASNGSNGVLIHDYGSLGGAHDNTIGGLSEITGEGLGNLISGNNQNGIEFLGIIDAAEDRNVVQGNLIGLDRSGDPFANGRNGILLGAGTGNTIGGPAAGEGNAISGNTEDGILITDSATASLVQGNLIGTTADGLSALANGGNGVVITTAGNTIGSGNVISGNTLDGVLIRGAGASGNLIGTNMIGTDVTGSYAVPNGSDGVEISDAPSNVVDAAIILAVGVISGNSANGILITGAGSTHNQVFGNHIGLDVTGTFAIPNGNDGVQINSGASYNTIGGRSFGQGNVISGNLYNGIEIVGTLLNNDGDVSASNNLIIGNKIGTDATGTTTTGNDFNPLGNRYSGVLITNSFANTIGGVGIAAEYRNVVSGNNVVNVGQVGGIRIEGTQSSSNLIAGNFIGTDSTGNSPLGNFNDGVTLIDGALHNTVGGSTSEARNVISGNLGYGVALDYQPTSYNLVAGNYIGLGADGSTPVGNFTNGVGTLGSSNNTIGGDAASGFGNVISSNGLAGVNLAFAESTGNLVAGNLIGTTADGLSARGNYYGVRIEQGASFNTVGGITAGEGNVISANDAVGLYIEDLAGDGTSGNLVQGNFIGTNSAGATDLGNTNNGLAIGGAQDNTIGGSAPGAGNVISANGSDNVDIYGATADGNVLQGNLIGLDPSGMFALPNPSLGFATGVKIGDGSGFNPSVPGTPTHTTVADNVISGNTGEGLRIDGGGYSVTTLTITGNKVGTNALGTAAVPNAFSGIVVFTSHDITIGGTTAADRNILSGNSGSGVQIVGSATTGIAVQGNTIGLAADGVTPLANTSQGVELFFKTHDNLIGGTAAGAGNVISANLLDGILISDTATKANLVQGNFIGTDATGLIASLAGPDGIPGTADDVRLGNGRHGVFINFSPGNTVGGTTAGLNVISGNGNGSGVEITGANSTNNLVAGNFIGLDANGTAGFKFFDGVGHPTRFFGTGVDIGNKASRNTIGGTTDAARNVISGNDHGIVLGDATENLIEGNYLGTDKTGLANVGQAFHNVRVNGGVDNTVGGTAAGAGNVIAGAGRESIYIEGATSTGDVFQGNKIGTDKDGVNALGNLSDGIHIAIGAHHITVGGSAPGAGNLIAGNAGSGISMDAAYGVSTHDNTVQANTIGLSSTGATLANRGHGVLVNQSYNNLIGGSAAGARNVISGNSFEGVSIVGADVPGQPGVFAASGNVVAGNFIGTSPDGKSVRPNGYSGVLLAAGANHNTIGGDSKAGLGNVISGNSFEGVTITDAGTSQNLVAGNLVGTAADGKSALGNAVDGVLIKAGASSNTIGGTAATAKNVISANLGSGVHLTDAGTSGNVIQGNEIGDALGAVALANLLDGVRFEDGAANNLLGGTVAGAGNVIAGNAGNGVAVGSSLADTTTVGDAILGNSIYSNGGRGIALTGFVANAPGGPHAGPNNLQNTPILGQVTSNSTTTTIKGSLNTNPTTAVHIEFFGSPSGSQGKTFLGSVDTMTDGSGNVTFSFNTASRLDPGVVVTATATVAGSTSQFSPTATVVQVPDDVTAVVAVTRSGFLYNRTTRRFTQTVTIKNNSGRTLSGPISLVLDNLSAGVSVFNPTGTTTAANPPAGRPYVNVVLLGGSLANGASASVQIQFVNPTAGAITYTTRVLAGPGTR